MSDRAPKTTLVVNGRARELSLDPRTTLLDALRDHLDLPGTHKGCDHGQCGACTVLIGGERVLSCLALAVMHDGDEITTVEGLAARAGAGDAPEALGALQAAFVAHDAFQCGFCTSGQLCSATALLAELARGDLSVVTPDDDTVRVTGDEIRERMAGNLCRCGAYPNLVAAIAEVAGQGEEGAS
ncbi:MAG: 2Fe-2S iron-sulfur cluster binding domain-containing protein [Myxococcales bacterium]|nr:2Fe-2S iron-sulfur cluster binding domain-containing protein [Myxococcales bacterium]MCB9737462.1 2Fe-2S iron-sulfur cluster binding domain-containing protein [Deltaproteobacteria bacterium]